MTSKKALFPCLGGLPGGTGCYIVPGLSQLLTQIATTPEMYREHFVAWAVTEFGIQRSTAANYIPTLVRLNVIERRRDKKLLITRFGRQFLAADDAAKISIMIDYLMPRYLALPEVLAVYGENDEVLHLDDVVERLRPHFKQWTTEAEFGSRIRWLVSLRCLEQLYGRQYEITEFGRETLKRFALRSELSSRTTEQHIDDSYEGSISQPSEDFQLPAAWNRQHLVQMLRAAADFVEGKITI